MSERINEILREQALLVELQQRQALEQAELSAILDQSDRSNGSTLGNHDVVIFRVTSAVQLFVLLLRDELAPVKDQYPANNVLGRNESHTSFDIPWSEMC